MELECVPMLSFDFIKNKPISLYLRLYARRAYKLYNKQTSVAVARRAAFLLLLSLQQYIEDFILKKRKDPQISK